MSSLQGKGGASALKRRGRRIHIIVAGAVVVLGAAVAVWFLSSGMQTSEQREKAQKPKMIQSVEPAKPQPRELTAAEKEALKHPGCVLSSVGVWQPTNRPWRANAKKVHNVYTNYSKTARQYRPYRNATEQLLHQIFSCKVGDCPTPLLSLPDADKENLLGILIDKPDFKEDDSRQMIRDKKLIDRAKKELREYVKNGGRPQNFFSYYHKQLTKAYETRQMAISAVNEVVTEGKDPGLAKAFRDELNKRLKAEGIQPITHEAPIEE